MRISLAIALLLALGCGPAGDAPSGDAAADATQDPRPASTRAMAARLEAIADAADHRTAPFAVDRTLAYLEQIPPPADARSRIEYDARRAQALLLAGRSAEALALYDAILPQIDDDSGRFAAGYVRARRHDQAIAAMRLAEQENCLDGHAPEMCILPLRDGAIHQRTEGARRAAGAYQALLADDPDDVTARWLLHIARQALGPAASAEILAADAIAVDLPRVDGALPPGVHALRNVGHAADVAVAQLSGGAAIADFDDDGRLDVMASSWGFDHPLRLLRSRGDGTFEDVSSAAGLDGLTGGLNLVHADADGDGRTDVLVLRGAWLGPNGRHPNSLLLNRGPDASGAVVFEDVTEAAGLLETHPTQTAAWADVDGDGRLDLFVGHESTPRAGVPSRLYRNLGVGADGVPRFEDVAAASGAAVRGYVKGAAFGDVDNDGDPDLYVSRMLEPNVLLRHEGVGDDGLPRYVDATAEAGVGLPENAFATWFWDADQDGWLDLFVASFPVDFAAASVEHGIADLLGAPTAAPRARLYRNRGDGTFDDASASAGLDGIYYAMGANHGDVNGDGYPDAYLGTGAPDLRALLPNRLLVHSGQPGAPRYVDATVAARVGHLQKGHGVAWADLDNDGDQDIYHVLGGAWSGDVFPNALFLNPLNDRDTDARPRWLTVRLEGVAANRDGLGARIAIEVVDADGDARTIHALVGHAGSFGGSSLQAEIGLGAATAIRRLTIRWPGSGTVDAIDDVPLDRIVRVREGSGVAAPVDAPIVPLASLPTSAGAHDHHHHAANPETAP
ncbi:MAG: CRTAC1 family protein [Acidobacteriota bacterium]